MITKSSEDLILARIVSNYPQGVAVDDTSILPLPLAKKEAHNLKEAPFKIPDSQITLLENPTTGEFIRDTLKSQEKI